MHRRTLRFLGLWALTTLSLVGACNVSPEAEYTDDDGAYVAEDEVSTEAEGDAPTLGRARWPWWWPQPGASSGPTETIPVDATPVAGEAASPTPVRPGLRMGRGMIVPAYLHATDAAQWAVVREAAAIMKSGSSARFKDFWVTVNSERNGPHASPVEWAAAAKNWDAVRASGGKIVGYVHTCIEPMGPRFRPLADVQREIRAWVEGYPNLDGIWLDEFYPRFEIAPTDGVVATFPNGAALAPKDRSFIDAEGVFNDRQVNPKGGYYEQLTSWIRATYPQLRIVGNAGGTFYSNQLDYYKLVDVVCSFEQTYEVAKNAPRNDWAALKRDRPNASLSQLALIHGNAADPYGAVDQAIRRGYSHVFTTDRSTLGTLWNGIPSYLTDLARYVANHP